MIHQKLLSNTSHDSKFNPCISSTWNLNDRSFTKVYVKQIIFSKTFKRKIIKTYFKLNITILFQLLFLNFYLNNQWKAGTAYCCSLKSNLEYSNVIFPRKLYKCPAKIFCLEYRYYESWFVCTNMQISENYKQDYLKNRISMYNIWMRMKFLPYDFKG